jgi:hypothetical protein
MAKMKINPRTWLPIGLVVLVLVIGILLLKKNTPPSPSNGPAPTPAPPVNVIPFKDRPYAVLAPLVGRNELSFTFPTLPKKAESVEVTLEYDRNKGVLDAVLKQFSLKKMPFNETVFLGTQSAGGHITYHEDVIGGTMTLSFIGADTYALKVPWRYDDTQKEYQDLSTSDGFFQATLTDPIKQPKVIVMQSPGAPPGLPSDPVAGPYVIRAVGPLPKTQATIKIRLHDDLTGATLWGYNGDTWTKVTSTYADKTVTGTTPLVDAYAVTP